MSKDVVRVRSFGERNIAGRHYIQLRRSIRQLSHGGTKFVQISAVRFGCHLGLPSVLSA